MGRELIVGARIERPHAVQRCAPPAQGRPREGGHDKSEEQEDANGSESAWQLGSSCHFLQVFAVCIAHYKSLAEVPEELSACLTGVSEPVERWSGDATLNRNIRCVFLFDC